MSTVSRRLAEILQPHEVVPPEPRPAPPVVARVVQRAVRLDATNPIAFLALARHHVATGNPEDASAFLDQARALFESEGELGSSVDVWGVGLRAWIDRAQGREDEADSRFDAARELSPEIWRDELLSADELR